MCLQIFHNIRTLTVGRRGEVCRGGGSGEAKGTEKCFRVIAFDGDLGYNKDFRWASADLSRGSADLRWIGLDSFAKSIHVVFSCWSTDISQDWASERHHAYGQQHGPYAPKVICGSSLIVRARKTFTHRLVQTCRLQSSLEQSVLSLQLC